MGFYDGCSIVEKKVQKLDYNTIEEMVRDAGLLKMVELAKEGSLSQWLADNFFVREKDMLDRPSGMVPVSDVQWMILLMRIFNLDSCYLPDEYRREVEQALRDEKQKCCWMDTSSDKLSFNIAEDDGDMMRLLKSGVNVVYLCGGEFHIPLGRQGVTYIGRGAAVIDLPYREDINFADYDIHLENLMLFCHHRINIAPDNLNNVRILSLEQDVNTGRRMFDFLSLGRSPFTPVEDFCKNAAELRDMTVGTVFLQAGDYDIDSRRFAVQPHWYLDYLDLADDISRNKDLYFTFEPDKAETLFKNERKLHLIAKLATDGNKLFIKSLYFDSELFGCIEIISTDKPVSSGSGFGLGGYGLDLIDRY